MFKQEYESGVTSQIMWTLFLIYHPSSEYYDLPLSTRTKLVLKDYLTEDFDLAAYETTTTKIISLTLTKTQAALQAWENKLEERNAFIAKQEYDANTFEMLDKMMEKTHKLWEQYFSIQKQLEKDQGRTTGDNEESLSDKGQI